jgi:ABC-type sugar transport system ATPase subunit
LKSELHYLHQQEWARSADDVLWRRSKLGLHYSAAQRQQVADWCRRHWGNPGHAAVRAAQPMQLKLDHLEQKVGASTHLYPLNLTLVPRAVTVLLGATQAGKTTLMRVMAGLDVPSAGQVLADGGQDVTGMPVRQRNVAMVYQQFINYPSMTVADNIASPLKLRGGLDKAAIAQRVQELAESCTSSPS